MMRCISNINPDNQNNTDIVFSFEQLTTVISFYNVIFEDNAVANRVFNTKP